jgi:hypothetical protein
MDYSRSQLVYQDEPTGLALKIMVTILPLGLLVTGIFMLSSGEKEGSVILAVEALAVGLLLWSIFPRGYRVYEDHLRIVLGGPFSVKIGFTEIASVETTSRTAVTIHFATAMARTYVIINKKSGLNIAITPKSNELFVENANRSLHRWQETIGSPGLTRPFK